VGEALIFGEDPIAAIQNPRLLAAGGDLGKVRHWRAPEFYIDHHLGELKADLAAHPETRLVVFDPLADHIVASTYTRVRSVMIRLRDLAREMKVAVLGIGHPPKGQPASIDAFGGSRGIVTVARAMWLVVKDDDGRRLFLWTKCNLSRVRTGLEFVSVSARVDGKDGRIEAPRASWVDAPVDMTADDWWFLEQARRKRGEPKGAKAAAVAFLEELLKNGPKLAEEVLQAAAEHEISRGTLHRAKESLDIRVAKRAVVDGPWEWMLPAPTKKPNLRLLKRGSAE